MEVGSQGSKHWDPVPTVGMSLSTVQVALSVRGCSGDSTMSDKAGSACGRGKPQGGLGVRGEGVWVEAGQAADGRG